MSFKIYNDDCVKIMKTLPSKSIDMVLTDPPYMFSQKGGMKGCFSKWARKINDEIDFISKGFDQDIVFNEFLRLCKIPNIIIFCSNSQLGKTITFFENLDLKVDVLVWSKTNPIPLCFGSYVSDIEYIVYVHSRGSCFNNDVPFDYKKKTKRYPIIIENISKFHPAQKPVEMLEELVEVHTNLNDVVLDCFMGSGSTGVACMRRKRNFIGIEIEEKYFDIAKMRITSEEKDNTLLWEENL
jgi:DNA modification methylase